jgi:phosphatidylglycerol:prolipoprotein diacylglycerol transferase
VPSAPLGPVLIAIRSLQPHWCALSCIAGFSAAWYLGRHRALQSRSTWSKAHFFEFFFYCVVGVLLGSRVGFVLLYGLEYWRNDWLYPFEVWDGRVSFHGGLCGLIVASESVALKQGRNTGDVLDFASPLVGLGILSGYIGRFIIGEYGAISRHVPREVLYLEMLDHVYELYAALLEGLVLGSVIWLFSLRPRPRLAPSGLFLAGYGLTAFFVEFFRRPDKYQGYRLYAWITQSQMLSAAIFVVGLVFLLRAYRSRDSQRQSPNTDGVRRG